MVVGDNVNSVEVLVVGGGPGGYSVAERCASQGLLVALVERAELGGTCLNVGCIPSKSLLHVAELAASARHSSDLGIDLSATVSMPRVQTWMQSVIDKLRGGVGARMASHKVDVIRGELRFEGPTRAIVVSDGSPQRFEFERVVIATGSTPIELGVLPIDGRRVIDSAGALALDHLPATMAVVGGGYIGVEIGTAYAKLGVKVTIVDNAPRIIASMPEALVRPVVRHLETLGVELLLGASVTGHDDKGLLINDSSGSVRMVPAEVILSAVGRKPNTAGLGLEFLGVELTPTGHVNVDGQRRAAANVYAIGDITEGPALAHKAVAEAEVVASAIGGSGARFEPACIPAIVFSDPEIVSVGLTAEEAAAEQIDAGTARRPLSASGRALTLDRTDGFMELVFNKQDRTILGIHMVGAGVAEMAGEAALAIEMAITVDDLALVIHPHPTLSEELPELANTAIGKLGRNG